MADILLILFLVGEGLDHLCQTRVNLFYLFFIGSQETVATGLDYEISVFGDEEKCYLQSLAIELEPKRDMLAKVLTELGMTPTIPEGGYFLMADISKLSKYS